MSSDWFNEEATGGQKEPDVVESAPEVIVPYEGKLVVPEPKEDQLAVCRELQNEVFHEALQVLDGALRFADLEDSELEDGSEPPNEWIKEMGLKRARRAHRLAKAANLPEKLAPAGIKVATNVMLGCLRAQAAEKSTSNTLNVAFVNMSIAEKKLPELEVEGEEVKSKRKTR